MKQTPQEEIWKTTFGEEYNHRNNFDNKELDDVYISDIGISRTAMNEKFIGDLDRSAKILEVGCNIGLQMVNLQEMGFRNLYGIELQPHAVRACKAKNKRYEYHSGNSLRHSF